MNDSADRSPASAGDFLKATPDGPVISVDGIRRLALIWKCRERDVMTELLRQDIWPERFSRCRSTLSAQSLVRLLSIRVLVAGCGGLGGYVAEFLARTGVGTLTLCDPDSFDESNLNRQRFCTERTLGMPKAEACRNGILDIASYMDVTVHAETLDENNLPTLLSGVDVVMDCLDSLARKKMLETAAAHAGVLCVQGSVARNEGLALFDGSRRLPFSRIYPDEETGNLEGASMHPHAVTVAGTAALMVSLLLRRLCHDKHDDGRLFHLDFSVPELETLCFSAGD